MITSEQLQEYLAGRMSADTRARFEEELAGDPEAVRQVLAQEKIDAALRMLLGRPERARILSAITAVVRRESTTRVKADVLRDVRANPPRRTNPFALAAAWFAARPAAAWTAGLATAALAVLLVLRVALPVADGPGPIATTAVSPAGVAELLEVRGRVVVAREGSTLEGANRVALRSGDSIRADANATGVIRLNDGTRVTLDGGAALALGGDEGKNMQLTAGRVSAEVAKQPAGKHVVLRTALATVTVHGTALALEAGPGSTRLDVREGWVRMAHAQSDSELELTGGEFALAVPNLELLGGLQPVPAANNNSATSPTSTASGDRDPALWPFAASSPWNTAIGSGAAFAPVQSTGLDLAGRGLVVLPAAHDRAVFISRPDDPVVPVLSRYEGGEWLRVRLAPDALRNTSRLLNCTVIDPQLGLAHELIQASRTGDGIEAMLYHTNPLRGSGTPPEQLGHTLSGMPLIAGVIRTGELQRGIRHALAASVIHHGVSRDGTDGRPFVWPARHVPMETRKREALSAAGNVHFGTLLAIPPEVDINSLGLAPDGPALELARALQDYGAYVTHSYNRAPNDGQGWTQPHLQLFAEGMSDAELRALHAEVSKLARHLRVVANNTPATPAGGGRPRRTPAPDFQPLPASPAP